MLTLGSPTRVVLGSAVTTTNYGIPRTDLLLQIRTPNSEDQPWIEGSSWDEEWPWGSWILPASLFATLGEGVFFDSGGTPLDVTGADILADADTNVDQTFFSVTKGIAIYADAQVEPNLSKIKNYMGLS